MEFQSGPDGRNPRNSSCLHGIEILHVEFEQINEICLCPGSSITFCISVASLSGHRQPEMTNDAAQSRSRHVSTRFTATRQATRSSDNRQNLWSRDSTTSGPVMLNYSNDQISFARVPLMEILSIVQSVVLQGNRLACRDAWQEATQPIAAQTMIRR